MTDNLTTRADKDTPSMSKSMEDPAFTNFKLLFAKRLETFRNDPDASAELEAYAQRDNTHDYRVLKGLVPQNLIGKLMPGGHAIWEKSDTFFTDFTDNHPDQVLSDTHENLLIIGNSASHDIRQYLAKWELDGKDRTPSAGMSYMHILIIPKRRVYNAVTLEDTTLIQEMVSSFHEFWRSPESIEIIIRWMKTAVEKRTTILRQSLEIHSPHLLDEFEAVMDEVSASTEEFEAELRHCHGSVLPNDDLLFFGFHPAPDASIAHLHMHVLLAPARFRKFSTDAHDWKTVPAQAIIEVFEEYTSRKLS
ncbi:hypothetical protein M422DRAFT_260867 [Sphaerobolus stellatus SS14]|uniref:HIT domain-containing protein n=1 Tax=Sphaerobolus stellatus (strain SS14) TaxID=990650 RepID=A0A0C9VHF7_SPHS4|nr:hypothetical protein M422DRAFT_260867 [Sphaerobolus stellatus SS14]